MSEDVRHHRHSASARNRRKLHHHSRNLFEALQVEPRMAEHKIVSGLTEAVEHAKVRNVIASIVVPCLMPTGDSGKCTVATVDQFGPNLADRFLGALSSAGYKIVRKDIG